MGGSDGIHSIIFLALAAFVGLIGSFIIDIMKYNRYDEVYYYFQGTYLKTALLIHIILWPIFMLLIFVVFALFYENENCLGKFGMFFLDAINISYIVLLGIIVFKPSYTILYSESFQDDFNEFIHSYKGIILMKKENSVDIERLYNYGMDSLDEDAKFQSVAHIFMFFLCAFLIISAPFAPCIPFFCC